jgi:pimeloyl-ACP methyl ester carboxylesterase
MLTGFADGAIMGERFGTEPVRVLALHGWQRTHADFAAVLAGSPGAVAIDLPGFGATPPPPETWGSASYARALCGLVDECGGPITIVGHSFGGRVAIQLAHLVPDAVRALVLTGVPQLAPGTATGRPNRRFQMVRAARRVGLVGEHRLERARMRYGSRDYREAEGVMRSVLVTVLAERYAPLLATIACPVALVWGGLDTTAPLEGARYAAGELARGELVVLDGVGHMVPTDAPQALRGALERVGR